MAASEPQLPEMNISERWLPLLAWLAAGGLALFALILVLQRAGAVPPLVNNDLPTPIPLAFGERGSASELPQYSIGDSESGINRDAAPDTIVPERTRVEAFTYTVQFGDSLFGIADEFGITPETVLWSNEAVLQDRPDILAPGMELVIPPVNGVYYQWDFGDSLDNVAKSFEVDPQAIVDFPGNDIPDLENPQINPGDFVMVPGGSREFRQWVFPDLGGGGVSANLLGPGACTGDYGVGNGTGSFVWPSPIQEIVGNDYWEGHRALDIASADGVAVYAADSGVVLFAGWANGGYGYMVYIDHGNGYSTLYAHLSEVVVTCGQYAAKGGVIAYGGNTGNSTGPHLHFEVRFQGGFLNPYTILP